MEKFWRWLSWHLPKDLVYFCGIRIMAHATTGKYDEQIVPDLTLFDAVTRWDTDHSGLRMEDVTEGGR